MNKSLINSICRKFGFELHGLGYIQSVLKQSFKEDSYAVQYGIRGNSQIIFDIGANRGDTVDRYLKLFPNAQIFAFEPFPDSFHILQDRFKEYSNVKCYQLAISDSEEQRIFYVNENVDTNSLLKPQHTGLSSDKQVENKKQIQVKSTTLDGFCKNIGIAFIDILKLDIQGGELAALQGARGMLAERNVALIYTETYFIQQYEYQPLFHDLSKFVFEFNYILKDIYSPIYGKGNIAWADVIFVQQKKM